MHMAHMVVRTRDMFVVVCAVISLIAVAQCARRRLALSGILFFSSPSLTTRYDPNTHHEL